MQVLAVTGGKEKDKYDKVVIMLHGGGGSGSDWLYQYNQGWFGNLSGLKYVFPTSVLPYHVWYISFKNGCGLKDDCAYNISSIEDSASRISALIQHERTLVHGDASKVYLGGFSQGAQLTSYMQIAKLNFALGGSIVMDGYPLPPLCDMPGKDPTAAKKNATYYGQDMRWMLWHGEDDQIFPLRETEEAYYGIFNALGVASTLKINHTEPGMTHTLVKSEFAQMTDFIRG
jgi:predicted esterase